MREESEKRLKKQENSEKLAETVATEIKKLSSFESLAMESRQEMNTKFILNL